MYNDSRNIDRKRTRQISLDKIGRNGIENGIKLKPETVEVNKGALIKLGQMLMTAEKQQAMQLIQAFRSYIDDTVKTIDDCLDVWLALKKQNTMADQMAIIQVIGRVENQI